MIEMKAHQTVNDERWTGSAGSQLLALLAADEKDVIGV